MPDNSDLISTQIAADKLGVKHRQVLNLINDGLLPATRVGRAWIIRRSDLAKVPKIRKPGPKPKVRRSRSPRMEKPDATAAPRP